MKKRIISLVLVVAMLLCVLPAASAAEEPVFDKYYLSLNKSIAINFKLSNYVGGDEAFGRVEFEKGGKLAQTIGELPAVGADGRYVFTFTELSPAELAEEITVKLYLKDETEPVATQTQSVLQYCNAILAGSYSVNLKQLAADLVNFGMAFRTYQLPTKPNIAEIIAPKSTSVYASTATPEAAIIDNADKTNWAGITLGLDDCVRIRFDVEAESAEGLTLEVNAVGKPYTVKDFEKNDAYTDKSVYSVYFDKLNPAQMHEVVTAKVLKDGSPYTSEVQYSIASYAATILGSDAYSANLKAVVTEMLKYGDAAYAYVTPADVAPAPVVYSNDFAKKTDEVWTVIDKTSAGEPMDKSFGGKLAIEYRFKVDTNDENFSASAFFKGTSNADGTGSDVTFAKIVFKGGKISCGDGYTTTGEYKAGEWYTVKTIVDPSSQSYDIYLDEKPIREDAPYTGKTQNVKKYFIQGADGTGTVYLDDLKVTKVLDSVDTTGTEVFGRNFNESDFKDGVYNLPANGAVFAGNTGSSACTGKLAIEYKIKVPKTITGSGVYATFKDSDKKDIMIVHFKDSKVLLGTNASIDTGYTYIDDTWYTVKIVADPVYQKCDVYLNGSLIATDIGHAKDFMYVNFNRFNTSFTGPAYFDDLTVTQIGG